MTSIYLPPDEETQIDIHLGKSKYTLDIFELEDLFGDAQKLADENATMWHDEFPKMFTKLVTPKGKRPASKKPLISRNQAILLWAAIRNQRDELKKKLLGESDDSEEAESKSPPKQ